MSALVTEPDWDLTPYFSKLGGNDYLTFKSDLDRDIDELQARADALPGIGADGEAWVNFLCDFEKLAARNQHLHSFVSCWTAADASDELGQREEASLALLSASMQKLWITLRAEFGAAAPAEFQALLSHDGLSAIRYLLERTRERAELDMPRELEALNADLAVNGLDAWGRLYDRISGNLRFELVHLPAKLAHPGDRRELRIAASRAGRERATRVLEAPEAVA